MSTYELDDNLVQHVLSNDLYTVPGGTDGNVVMLFNALREQFPIPTPTGLGAVIQTAQGMFVRAETGKAPWFFPGGTSWYTDDELPRITEVLWAGIPDLTG